MKIFSSTSVSFMFARLLIAFPEIGVLSNAPRSHYAPPIPSRRNSRKDS